MKAAMVMGLIVMATAGGAWMTERHEEPAAARGRWAWVRVGAYWLFTVLVSFELAAGGVWDLLRIEYVREGLAHLGYPLYLTTILAVWRIPGALVLLAPGLRRLKEWAYAGAVAELGGAAASHVLRGDGIGQWAPPLMLAGFALLSWGLRPASRRLAGKASEEASREPAVAAIRSWTVAVGTVVAMLVVAYFTLPAGAPPQ